MSRPRLLDLFCKAGGAAKGYHDAGFEVVGVDIEPQPRYPFEFHQADALEFVERYGREFDAIHASPPCQAYCALKHLSSNKHPELIEPTRAALMRTGRPYVIENVPGAPLVHPLILCGTMFKLCTPCGAELRRHRLFECSELILSGMYCDHGWSGRVIGVYGGLAYDPSIYHAESRLVYPPRVVSVHGEKARARLRALCVTGKGSPISGGKVITVTGHSPVGLERRKYRPKVVTVTGNTPQQNVVRNEIRETFSVESARVAMGIDWMGMKDLSQAIPPAYTEFIGGHLLEILNG